MAKHPFIPPPLPPKLDFSGIIPHIVKARDMIARYDEAVKRLPNPEIIQRTFETKEAVLSSKIEGTQATFEEVLQFDAQEVTAQESEKEKDYREIANYRYAIKRGKELLKERPLAENVIKELHKILLNSVRGHKKAPGELRKTQVFIGKYGTTIEQASFVPPEPQNIPPLLSNLEKYLYLGNVVDPVVQIAIAHYQFEAIHPFMDGNGRVGRLIVPLFLYEKKITSYPNIYISEFLEKHRDIYYDLLKNISGKNEWIPWITFFLDAVYEQTKISMDRVRLIEELHRKLNERMPSIGSIYANSFLDALFIKPRFTAKSIRETSKINNTQTLYTIIEKFEKANIIHDVNPKQERNKTYTFIELLKIVR